MHTEGFVDDGTESRDELSSVIPKRNRHQEGWVVLDKSSVPHRWRAKWFDSKSLRISKRGHWLPTRRSLIIGVKGAEGLATKADAEAKWDRIRTVVMNPDRPGSSLKF